MSGRVFILLLLGLASACSSQRKLSHVDTREPTSTGDAAMLSGKRVELKAFQAFKPLCPAEIKTLLPELAEARVKFPPCPDGLETKFETAVPFLKVDVKAVLEDILGSQCRTINRESGDDSLGIAIAGLAPSPADSRLLASEPAVENAGTKALAVLASALEELRVMRQPLDQWVARNGEFVVPDEAIEFLQRLVARDACTMTDQEIDSSYRTIHSLEQLARTEREGEPQRTQIEHLLAGIHIVIDRKLVEFFHR